MQHFKFGFAVFFLVTLTSLQGLAAEPEAGNPYTQNYKEHFSAPKRDAGEAPRVFRGTNREADYQKLLEEGYDQLGTSSFQSEDVDPDKLDDQANKVRADIALVYTSSLGKPSIDAKLEAAKAKMATKEPVEKAPGEGQLIEYPQPRYDYYATFWMKLPTPVLGLHVRDRKDDDGQPGVPVIAVIKGSPAALADIRKDDVVLKIADVDAKKGDDFVKTVRNNAGKSVDILLLRDDILVSKTVKLNAK